ncbi:MAG: antibiotic ABC transporter ATP-binding protein [Flavobacteriia bacterium]|nr:MAG: antibiotic ABC transporter ATP-binding protein [Flavobacteriia bacterium]
MPDNNTNTTGRVFDLKVFRRIISYAKRYRWPFVLTGITAVLLSFLATARPLILIEAVNRYIAPRQESGLLTMIILMLVILMLEVLFQFVFVYSANWLGQHIIKDIRYQVFKHIIHFRMAYFNHASVGRLVTRVVNDLETIAQFFSQGLFMIVSDLLKMLVVLIAMFAIDWSLTLIALIILPVLLWFTRYFQLGIKKSFQEVRKQIAHLNSFVQERLTGMSIIQLFTREKIEYENFKRINAKYKNANIKVIWYYSVFFPVVEILSSIAIGLLVWYGGLQATTDSSVQAGEIIGFIMMTQMLYRPMRQIADKFNTIQMGIVAGERVFKILDTDARTPRTGTIPADHIKGKIEFSDVSFNYVPDETVLKHLSFCIKPGEKLAIVGSTGAGKSTIINLITRFYDITQGQLLIDDVDIKDYDLNSLRHHIAIVLQDVFLFSDSIYKNITLGNSNISKEAIIDTAQTIGVHEFIESLPQGYDYNVHERGIMLSSGQRQLIAFLRAYVSNPKILILDEATSSVDTHSEELIRHALDAITENRTSIIIAHRLATVLKADRILVMDQGQIVEEGSHAELLAIDNGVYKNLYQKQFLKTDEV